MPSVIHTSLDIEQANYHWQTGGGAPIFFSMSAFMNNGPGSVHTIDEFLHQFWDTIENSPVGSIVVFESNAQIREQIGAQRAINTHSFYTDLSSVSDLNLPYIWGDVSAGFRGYVVKTGDNTFSVNGEIRPFQETFDFEEQGKGPVIELVRAAAGTLAGNGTKYEIVFDDSPGILTSGTYYIPPTSANSTAATSPEFIRVSDATSTPSYYSGMDLTPTQTPENQSIQQPNISISDSFAIEGASLVFEVSLSFAPEENVTFELQTYKNGTESDYVGGRQFITITAGQTPPVYYATVQTLPDSDVDPGDVMYVAIENVSGAVVLDPTDAWGAGTIIDNTSNHPGGDSSSETPDSGPATGTTSTSSSDPETTGGSNVAIISFGASTSGASSGTEVEVTFTVKNLGDESTSRNKVDILLSNSADLQGSRYIGDTFSVSELAPGEERTYTRLADLPIIGNNEFYLGADVRSVSLGHNTVESDDYKSIPFRIGPGLSGDPDLFARLPRQEGIFQPNEVRTVSYETQTNANGSPGYRHGLYLSTDNVFSTDDIELYEGYNGGLGYIGVGYHSATVAIPDGTPSGIYHLIAVADTDNRVGESDEGDNYRTREIVVSGRAADANLLTNIVGSHLEISSDVLVAGNSYSFRPHFFTDSIDDPVALNANGTSDLFSQTLFLSNDASPSADDIPIRTGLNSIQAEYGHIGGSGTSFSLPTWILSGEYYVYAEFNSDRVVEEDFYDDNFTSATAVTILNSTVPEIFAVDDTLAVDAGGIVSVDLSANDIWPTSYSAEPIVLRFEGDYVRADQALEISDEYGVQYSISRDGNLLIDATTFAGVGSTVLRYELRSLDNNSSSLGRIHVDIGDQSQSVGGSGPQVFSDGQGLSPNPELSWETFDERFVGTAGNDIIYGGTGEDWFTASAGDDIYYGGDGVANDPNYNQYVVDDISISFSDIAWSYDAETNTLSSQHELLGSDQFDHDVAGFWFHDAGWFSRSTLIDLIQASPTVFVGGQGAAADPLQTWQWWDERFDGPEFAGDEIIYAGAGDDDIVASSGNDIVYGGEGYNQITVIGDFSDFAFSIDSDTGLLASTHAEFGYDQYSSGIDFWFQTGGWKGYDEIYDLAMNDVATFNDGDGTPPDPAQTWQWWDERFDGPEYAGDEFIFGGTGDDDFVASPGDDVIDGGEGYNQVSFLADFAEFDFSIDPISGNLASSHAVLGYDQYMPGVDFWFQTGGWMSFDMVVNLTALPTAGDDVFIASPHHTSFEGGVGWDELQYLGEMSHQGQFSITRTSADGVTITNDYFGTDELAGIEGIWFEASETYVIVADIPLVDDVTVVNGTAGDDLFVAEVGNFEFNDIGGFDQIDYAGPGSEIENFTFTQLADGGIQIDSSEFGRQTLYGVESAWFESSSQWSLLEDLIA